MRTYKHYTAFLALSRKASDERFEDERLEDEYICSQAPDEELDLYADQDLYAWYAD